MIEWDPVVRAHGSREVGRLRAGRRLAISPDRLAVHVRPIQWRFG